MAKPKPTKKKPSIDLFIKFYLLNSQNGTQAAIDAGYSEKSASMQASRLLTTDKVKKALAEAQRLETESFIWSKTKKLEMLQNIVTKSLRSIVDQQGNEKMENPASAVTAIKEHNLMQGDNAPTELNNNIMITKADDVEW
jgi:phage terminase small subunit